MVVLAAHSSMLALLYLPVSLVFDYGSWIPAFIPGFWFLGSMFLTRIFANKTVISKSKI